jgi:predicted nucleic acid-binding protein
MIFADTSAAVKFYVAERESDAVRRRFETEDEVYLSELARVELAAAFHRYFREGKWPQQRFLAMNRQLARDDAAGFWTWLPLDRTVLNSAAAVFPALGESVFLRSSDCIHLCTALRHKFKAVLTYDVAQTKAATALGLEAVTA